MLNRTDIRRECHRVTFERGESLNQRGAVHGLEWHWAQEDGFDVVRIRAQVEGDSGKIYEVNVGVDEEYREILDHTCTCPAWNNYSGLCKHCAAVLFAYLEERKKGGKGSGKTPTRFTSAGFQELLDRYAQNAWKGPEGSCVEGQVRLEPSFELRNDKICLSFRVGISRMYVLKNIGSFVYSVAAKERVRYGKELEFVHSYEAFAPEYRPLVRFLVYFLITGNEWQDRYLHLYYKKELAVPADRLHDFLESVRGIPLLGKGNGRIEREWEVKEGLPGRKLMLEGDGEGITVHMKRVEMLQAGKYVYFFRDGVIYQEEKEKAGEIMDFLRYMEKVEQIGLYVAGPELPAFTRDMLPVLSRYFKVEMKSFDPAAYLPEEADYELYLDLPQRELLSCSLYAVYGETRYNLFKEADSGERRNFRQERMVTERVSSFFTAFDPQKHQMVIDGEGEIYTFLREGLPELQELCQVYISDAVKAIRILPPPRVQVGVSLSGELLELSIASEELPLDQLVSILSRYDRKRKYFRLKDGNFVDLSDEGLRLLADVKAELGISDKQLQTGAVELPRYRAMYLDGRLEEDGGVSLHRDRHFRNLVRNMKTAQDGDYEVPPELDPILRGYQKTGFRWISSLKENGFGGILADDMGLGKTLQVIAFLLAEWRAHLEEGEAGKKPSSWRALVVCPASLVYNWKSELDRFAPSLPVELAAGSGPDRGAVLEETKNGREGVLITSYDLLRRDIGLYDGLGFACQIIDEAQFIKNHTTQAAQAVKQVRSPFRLALTGTPVENRLSELWSIFDYLMPGFLFSYSRFREELETPIVSRQDEEAGARLQKMIRPFVLRRRKQDVLTDLPDKIEKNMYAVMDGEQKELYDAHVQRLVQVLGKQTEQEYAASRIQVLAELTKLRQLCCDPGLVFEGYQGGSAKMALCLELIRSAADGGHKILLFSQFTSMLERLKEAMEKEKISFFSLDGSTPKAKRLELAERFNQDDTRVFCISLKAGGTGLNLTGADMVIHFDPWWNVAVQNQASDRAHRIGQKNVVTVYRLIARDTIEERIVALQERKKELAEQILGQEGMGMAALTKEALMEILGVGAEEG